MFFWVLPFHQTVVTMLRTKRKLGNTYQTHAPVSSQRHQNNPEQDKVISSFFKCLPREGSSNSVYQCYMYQYLSWDRKNIFPPVLRSFKSRGLRVQGKESWVPKFSLPWTKYVILGNTFVLFGLSILTFLPHSYFGVVDVLLLWRIKETVKCQNFA